VHSRHYSHHARVTRSGRDCVKLAKIKDDIVLGFVVHNSEVGINASSQLRGELVLNFLLLWPLFFQSLTILRLLANTPLHVAV
jgi:hypothetical protein